MARELGGGVGLHVSVTPVDKTLHGIVMGGGPFDWAQGGWGGARSREVTELADDRPELKHRRAWTG